jgi:PAS domain S-box-containing protein
VETEYMMLLRHTNDAVILTDDQQIICDLNPAFQRLSGYSRNIVIGHPFETFVKSIFTSQDEACEALREQLEQGNPVLNRSLMLTRSDATSRPVTVDFVPFNQARLMLIIHPQQQTTQVSEAQDRHEDMVTLAAIHELSAAINYQLHRDPLIESITNALSVTTGMEIIAIHLIDQATGEVQLATTHTAPILSDIASSGVIERAIQSRQIIELYAGEHNLEQADIKALLCLPLNVGSDTIGTVTLASRAVDRISRRRLIALSTICQEIGTAIRNAEIYEAEQRQRQLAETLQYISEDVSHSLNRQDVLDAIVRHASDLVDAESCSLQLLDNLHRVQIVVAAFGEPLIRTKDLRLARGTIPNWGVTTHQNRVIENDLEELEVLRERTRQIFGVDVPMTSLMVVPVRRGSEVNGTLLVLNKRDGGFTQHDADQLEKLAASVSSAIRNAELFEAEQRERRLSETLRYISEDVSQSLNRQQVFDAIAKHAKALIKVERCILVLLSDGRTQMTAVAADGKAAEAVKGKLVSRTNDHPDWENVIRQGKSSIHKFEDFPKAIKKLAPKLGSTRSALVAPLRYDKEIIGVIVVVDRLDGLPFDDDDIEQLEKLTASVSSAIRNAEQFETEQRQHRLAEALRRMSEKVSQSLDRKDVFQAIAHEFAALSGAKRCTLALLNEDESHLHIVASAGFLAPGLIGLRLGRGIHQNSWDTIDTGQTQVSRTRKEMTLSPEEWARLGSPRSSIVAPLRRGETIIGTVSVIDKADGTRFTEEDARQLEIMAASVSSAIRNAELFEAEQRQRELSETLRRISIDVSRSLNRQEVFDAITRRAQELIDAEESGLVLFSPEHDGAVVVSANGPLLGPHLHQHFPQSTIANWEKAVGHLQPVLVNTPSDFAMLPPSTRQVIGSARSALLASLRSNGKIVGVAGLLNKLDGPFTEDDAEQFEKLTASVSAAIRNAEMFEELQQAHDKLEARVEERTVELKAANEMKSKLLSVVSHELGKPLQVIKSYTSILTEFGPNLEADRQQEMLSSIDYGINWLARLTGDLVDYSQAQANTLRVIPETVMLRRSIETACREYHRFWPEHNISAKIADDVPERIPGDPERVYQVVGNLIENAVKYSPPDGTITVNAAKDGAFVAIFVEDEGDGIPEHLQEEIFEPFHRGVFDENLKDSRVGLGLGLAICKELVEQHGGKIWVENRPSGGSRFIFTLPIEGTSTAPNEEGNREND